MYRTNQQELNGLFKRVKRAVKKVVKAPVKVAKKSILIQKKIIKKSVRPIAKIALAPIIAPLALQKKVMTSLMPMPPAIEDQITVEQPSTFSPATLVPIPTPVYTAPNVSPPAPIYSSPISQPVYNQTGAPDWGSIDFSYNPLDFTVLDNLIQSDYDYASQTNANSKTPYEIYAEQETANMPLNYEDTALEGLFSGLKDKLKKVVQKAGVAVATAYGGPVAGAAVKGLLDKSKNREVQQAVIDQAGNEAVMVGLPRQAGESEARKQIGLSMAAKVGIGAAVVVPVIGLAIFLATRRGR